MLIAVIVVLGFAALLGIAWWRREDLLGAAAPSDAAVAFVAESEDVPDWWRWVLGRLQKSAKHPDLPDDRARRPILAGVVLTAVLAFITLGQLDSVLGGMHLESDKPVAATSITGGPLGWAGSNDVLASLAVWRRWECVDVVGIVSDCQVGDTTQEKLSAVRDEIVETGTGSRKHAPPASVATLYYAIDIAFALAYGVLALWALAALHERLAVPRNRTVLRRLALLVPVAVVADLVENITLIHAVNTLRAPAAAFLIVAKLKWVISLVAASIVYTTLVGKMQRDHEWDNNLPQRWGQALGSYLRGLGGLRAGLIAVFLTWLIYFAPILGEQMLDVVRRWHWLHVVSVALLVVAVTLVAGQSARRVMLRVRMRIHRFEQDPGPHWTAYGDDPPRARAVNRLGGWAVLGFGVIGVATALFGLPGRGMAMPAGVVLLMAWAGRYMSDDPLPTSATGEIRIGTAAPAFIAAAIPLLIGLGTVRAIVPEFVLANDRSSSGILPLSLLLVGVMFVSYTLLANLRESLQKGGAATFDRMVDLAWTTAAILLGVLVATVLLLGYLFITREPPTAMHAVPEVWLLIIGVSFVALAHTAYYLFDDSPRAIMRAGRRFRAAKGKVLLPSPATLLPGPSLRGSPIGVTLFAVLGVTVGITIGWLVSERLDGPRLFGGTSVALLWVLTLVVGVEALTRFAEASMPPRLIRALGMKRTPLILLMIGWVAVMSSLFPSKGFHDEVVQGRGEAEASSSTQQTDPPMPLTIDSLFEQWVERNRPDGSTLEHPAVPMIFVSAWGGGIRAAAWTALVVDCAFEEHQSDPVCHSGSDDGAPPARLRIVTMSGISGGSLGSLEYVARVTAPEDNPPQDWVRTRLGDDYLSPPLARLFFIDLPFSAIGGSDKVPDRGDVLREAWESSWEGSGAFTQGMRALWADRADLPLVIANGASVNDRCAINASPFESGSGTGGDCTGLAPFSAAEPGDAPPAAFEGELAGMHDVLDFLCLDEDLSLSALAMMSARFPVISPTGRLVRCAPGSDESPIPKAIYSTDGGQLELSATLTSIQMWEAVESRVAEHNATALRLFDTPEGTADPKAFCIIPMAIHIENGFGEPSRDDGEHPPNEWVDPLTWIHFNAQGGLVSNARQRLAIEFSEPLVAGDRTVSPLSPDPSSDNDKDEVPVRRFAFIRNHAHPGASAPLGWALSSTTLDDLVDQLELSRAEFQLIETWLSGDLSCSWAGP